MGHFSDPASDERYCHKYEKQRSTHKQISEKDWDKKSVPQIKELKTQNLVPILSTAYGLAISTEHDNLVIKHFKDIFKQIRGASEVKRTASKYDRYNHGFSYTDDYDAIK